MNWQSYSIFCSKLTCNHNLNLTLSSTLSSMLFLGCCWLQDPSSVTGTRFSFSDVLPYLYQKGVEHTTSLYKFISLAKAHTEASMSPPSLTVTHFPCTDKWNAGLTTTTHHPTTNSFSLTLWPPPMICLSFSPQASLLPKKCYLLSLWTSFMVCFFSLHSPPAVSF